MSLRDIATADLNKILAADFSRTISITDPADTTVELPGFTNDIAQIIDAETGQIVSGRIATVAISLRELANAGLDIPVGIADATKKPWRITFTDMEANSYRFKISASNPDRALGIVTCELELYDD